jgi:uncharacterized Fe-S center protein
MINYKRILQESKDKKFDAIASKKDVKDNSHTCYYSPKSHHKYCEHDHCILDKEWQRKQQERNTLQKMIEAEESYLKNGEGTVGYDRLSVYKNVLKLRKLLGERRK